MPSNTELKTTEVLLMLQCCHSILGTAWPRPGCKELSGAGGFIGTKLFTALENGAAQLSTAVEAARKEGLETEVMEVWNHCEQVIQVLKSLKGKSRHAAIDQAFNLLYLATGVLYQQIANKQASPPKQDKRFATVEDLKILIRKCEWQPGATPDLVARIDSAIVHSIRDLSALASGRSHDRR